METEKLHILCVDDSKNAQLLYKRTCESLGYSVEIASNGIDAQQKLMKQHFSLVISDFMMDGMDGIELLSWMRSNGVEAYFILISAYHNSSFETLSTVYSECEFHPKPLLVPTLKKMLRSVAENVGAAANLQNMPYAASSIPSFNSNSSIPSVSVNTIIFDEDTGKRENEIVSIIAPNTPPIKKRTHPFGAALLNGLKVKLTGFESAVIYDLATRDIIDWTSSVEHVTGDFFAARSMNIVSHFVRMNGHREMKERMPMALTVLSDEHIQYFTTIEPTVVLHVILRREGVNIGMMKLALFKVINQFASINQK